MGEGMRQKTRVLVIDDDPDTLEAIGELLSVAGMFPVTVDGVVTGLSVLCDFTPDVILLDMHMPGLDGVDFLRHYHGRARIVVMTASPPEQLPVEVFATLRKPRDLNALIETIQRAAALDGRS